MYGTEQTGSIPAEEHWERPVAAQEGCQGDFIFRVQFTGTAMRYVGAMRTQDAMYTVGQHQREKKALADAVIGCGRYMEYIGHHIAFLSGEMAPETFDAISQDYCVSPGADIRDLADRIHIILRETGVDFPPEQLEEFCSATTEEIEAALRVLAERGLVEVEG